jgi:hypothetical protein
MLISIKYIAEKTVAKKVRNNGLGLPQLGGLLGLIHVKGSRQ